MNEQPHMLRPSYGPEARSSVGGEISRGKRDNTPEAVTTCTTFMHVFSTREATSCACGARQRPTLGAPGGRPGKEKVT